MSFSAQLRAAADPIFEAIFRHPFVRGIGDGRSLRPEQLIHYVKQDFEYLNAYMRVYGLAMSKCTTREDIAMFHEKTAFILNSEIHPHNNFCRAAGVRYEELQGYPLAPSAHHYILHMLKVAHEGNLGEIIAVLLPCPWTYLEIGQRLVQEVNPGPDHPYNEWIRFYASERVETSTANMCGRLDAWAEQAGEEEKQRMEEHFILSTQLELKFWEMAYSLEQWPVPLAGKQPAVK